MHATSLVLALASLAVPVAAFSSSGKVEGRAIGAEGGRLLLIFLL
jgi:hypothetical protein